MEYITEYLKNAHNVIDALDYASIEKMVHLVVEARDRGGRLFILGVGGSAANASHAVNDFRKIAGMEAYAPTDNVSELTARVNDDGWDTALVHWLEVSRLAEKDLILVLSVGGGDLERNVSVNLVRAVQQAKEIGARICGIVGRDGGYTAKAADACVVVPTVDNQMVTPLAESFQAVIWHLVVTHPEVKMGSMKWESSINSA